MASRAEADVPRTEKRLRLLVLAAWFFAFVWLLQAPGGTPCIHRFLHRDLAWLVPVGMVVVALFAFREVLAAPRAPTAPTPLLLLRALLLLLPLIYLPVAASADLATGAFAQRATANTLAPRYAASETAGRHPLSAPTVLDILQHARAYNGRTVTLTGMVHHDKNLPAHHFFCYRFLIWCCAADATPAGLSIRHRHGPDLPAGAWVEVTGTVGTITLQGQSYPRIEAETIRRVEPPAMPYIFP